MFVESFSLCKYGGVVREDSPTLIFRHFLLCLDKALSFSNMEAMVETFRSLSLETSEHFLVDMV